MNSTSGVGRIAVLDAYFADVLEAMDGGGPYTVWVLAGDGKLRMALTEGLSAHASLGVLGSRLDDAADWVTRDLLDLDQQVLPPGTLGEAHRLAWSASLIGDRSPYAGDLQLNTARYLVMDEVVRAGGRHLFFVESDLVAAALERAAKDNGLDVTRRGGKVRPPLRADVLRARVSALKSHVQQSHVLKKLRRTRPAPWARLAECDVLLVDWVGSSTFSSDGETVRTGNLVRMADILRQAGLKVGFVGYPLSWTQPYGAIAENATHAFDPVVLTDECRSVMSVLRGGWATWRLSRRLKKARCRMAGHDLSALFDFERTKDLLRPQATLAHSLVDVAKTLAQHGVRPKALIHPFENQGWERALGAGMRRYLPDTRLIAYQHAPFATRYIGFYPSASDVAAGRLADQLIVMGPRFAELFVAYGWPKTRVVLGGSLRFEPALLNPPTPPEQGSELGKVILAATSIDFAEALDLVVKAGAVVHALTDARLVVNFHPVVDQAFRDGVREGLVKALANIGGESAMDRVDFSTQRARDLIGQADVLVYNNSGAVFDAYFCGVVSVYVAMGGRLNFDKVPGNISRRVADGDDLSAVVRDIFAADEKQTLDMTVGGVISPVDERAILKAVRGQ